MKILFSILFITFSLAISANAPGLIDVVKFINHTGSEIARNKAAIVKINEVSKSECFKSFMIERKLIDTNGLNNIQVVEKLLSTPVILELEMYKKAFSKVNGYTYSTTKRIWLNRKYHNYYGVCSVANNLAHEISHKQGFGHDFKASTSRAFSVPYSINLAFSKCCND